MTRGKPPRAERERACVDKTGTLFLTDQALLMDE